MISPFQAANCMLTGIIDWCESHFLLESKHTGNRSNIKLPSTVTAKAGLTQTTTRNAIGANMLQRVRQK